MKILKYRWFVHSEAIVFFLEIRNIMTTRFEEINFNALVFSTREKIIGVVIFQMFLIKSKADDTLRTFYQDLHPNLNLGFVIPNFLSAYKLLIINIMFKICKPNLMMTCKNILRMKITFCNKKSSLLIKFSHEIIANSTYEEDSHCSNPHLLNWNAYSQRSPTFGTFSAQVSQISKAWNVESLSSSMTVEEIFCLLVTPVQEQNLLPVGSCFPCVNCLLGRCHRRFEPGIWKGIWSHPSARRSRASWTCSQLPGSILGSFWCMSEHQP